MRPKFWNVLGCAAALLFCGAHPAESASKSLDPKAMSVLKKMSDSLAGAKSLSYRARTAFEVPSRSGQLLTLFSTSDVAIKRPNMLRAKFTGSAPHFQFFYDGARVAAFAPETNIYSVAKAPATIDAMLLGLEEETGIRYATAGLLFSDPYAALSSDLTSAMFVGRTSIDGIACDHLAFRADGVDWEIWIEAGPRALPLRLAVTYTERAGLPRTLVDFSGWNLSPWLRASEFVFRPPAEARELPFDKVMQRETRP